MRMMRIFVIGSILFLLIFISTLSCVGGNCPYCDDFLSVKPPDSQLSCTVPDVEVFIDATYSMQGFTKAGLDGRFIQLSDPDNLEIFLNNAFETPIKPKYFILKDTVKKDTFMESLREAIDTLRPITREQLRTNIIKPDFFTGLANDYAYVFRRILRQYKDEDTSKLYILITDLFQTDNDITKLLALLDSILIDYNLTLAVVGFKAEFDGLIYDITKMYKKVPYKGQRNLFFLIMGQKCHVYKLINSLPIGEYDNYTIFTKDPIDSIWIDNVSSPNLGNLGYNHRSFCGKRKTLIDTLTIITRWSSYKNVFIGNSFRAVVTPITDRTDGCKEVMRWIREGIPKEGVQETPQDVIQYSLYQKRKNHQIILKLTVNTGKLQSHCGQRGFAFLMDVKPSRVSSAMEWFKRWNMDVQSIDLSRRGRTSPERGKTYNLYTFGRRLYNLYSPRINDMEVIYGCIRY